MAKRYYATKNNKVVSNISVSPFSKEAMDKFCEEQGYDNWFELDYEGALTIMELN